jgi:hypothetical protein
MLRLDVNVFQVYFEEMAKPPGISPGSKLPFNLVAKHEWKKARRGRGFFPFFSRKDFLE